MYLEEGVTGCLKNRFSREHRERLQTERVMLADAITLFAYFVKKLLIFACPNYHQAATRKLINKLLVLRSL